MYTMMPNQYDYEAITYINKAVDKRMAKIKNLLKNTLAIFGTEKKTLISKI